MPALGEVLEKSDPAGGTQARSTVVGYDALIGCLASHL